MSIQSFQERVFSYFAAHGRDLSFRKTRDPYHILLSEVILQQTQVDRGTAYWERFKIEWPTVALLARAEMKDILRLWMGLGYNSRAFRLREAAMIIHDDFAGDVLAALRSGARIPGIGPYTNAAVRIFADNEDLVAIDTNIRRILIHEFSETVNEKELFALAWDCLPRGRSRDWHNALMDYGATLMTVRKTGIRPMTRQSRFEGSDRQVRAGVLRALIEGPKDFSSLKTQVQDARLARIVSSLVKEGLVKREGNRFSV